MTSLCYGKNKCLFHHVRNDNNNPSILFKGEIMIWADTFDNDQKPFLLPLSWKLAVTDSNCVFEDFNSALTFFTSVISSQMMRHFVNWRLTILSVKKKGEKSNAQCTHSVWNSNLNAPHRTSSLYFWGDSWIIEILDKNKASNLTWAAIAISNGAPQIKKYLTWLL